MISEDIDPPSARGDCEQIGIDPRTIDGAEREREKARIGRLPKDDEAVIRIAWPYGFNLGDCGTGIR
jgi:hypothetical protein